MHTRAPRYNNRGQVSREKEQASVNQSFGVTSDVASVIRSTSKSENSCQHETRNQSVNYSFDHLRFNRFAGDVKVRAVMTTDPEDEPVTSFTADTPKLFAMFKTTGIKNGDKLRGVLIAEDVGDVAPANTKVLEKTLTLEEDTDDGDLHFRSRPKAGRWANIGSRFT